MQLPLGITKKDLIILGVIFAVALVVGVLFGVPKRTRNPNTPPTPKVAPFVEVVWSPPPTKKYPILKPASSKDRNFFFTYTYVIKDPDNPNSWLESEMAPYTTFKTENPWWNLNILNIDDVKAEANSLGISDINVYLGTGQFLYRINAIANTDPTAAPGAPLSLAELIGNRHQQNLFQQYKNRMMKDSPSPNHFPNKPRNYKTSGFDWSWKAFEHGFLLALVVGLIGFFIYRVW